MKSLAVSLSLCSLALAAPRFQFSGSPGSPVRKAMAVLQGRLASAALTVELKESGGASESFAITRLPSGAVQVAGGDAVGLAYGLYELAGQIESRGVAGVTPVTRAPAVRKRGMTVFLYNEQLESAWIYDRAHWERYFELLARSRINYFNLVFGHQTSYLAPMFPFFVEVPGYERVRPVSLPAGGRERNLAMLRMVSELAEEWGIRFVLGVWQQHAHLYGKNLVEGLAYQDLFDYGPKALALILEACPRIRGVQFRMNIESGIEEDDQNRFYTGMARAIRDTGRNVEVDFRAKGLRPETVDSALALGIRPVVSTKYWREHMGLPFHGTRIDDPDRERSYRRYGYWDLLYQDRPYDVAYRMWTLGSAKLLLWGGLDYAIQFAASSRFGGSIGFEVCAPLSQKGFGNYPGGAWRIFAAPELEYFQWEFERYWAYYLSFGLAGYAPTRDQPILDAEFRRRFGPAAPGVRRAYEAASWIIPFITATRAVSNSNFGYWPEMETGGSVSRYLTTTTGDDNRFYRIDAYVADLLDGRLSARQSPDAMAEKLEAWAAAADAAIAEAAGLSSGKELEATRRDFGVLAALARYHAARMRSATEYGLFLRAAERFRLDAAIRHYDAALAQWRAICRLTDGVFYKHMVFNRPPDQIGVWQDELPILEAELRRLRDMARLYPKAVADPAKTIQWLPAPGGVKMVMKWKEENGTLKRWASEEPAGDSSDAPESVLRRVIEPLRYRKILHAPIAWLAAANPVPIRASVTGERKSVRLRLFHRLAGAGFEFKETPMVELEENVYVASIPSPGIGSRIFYYIRADAGTVHFHGSAKVPHQIVLRGGAPPRIRRVGPRAAVPGQAVRVQAEVQADLPLAAVRLHYRHQDQSEDWRVIPMHPDSASSLFTAWIPEEFVVPGWDLQYAIEAVDESGAGAFSPDHEQQDPVDVIPVERRK